MKIFRLGERVKKIYELICSPPRFESFLIENVTRVHINFYAEKERLIDRTIYPPARPAELKVEVLGKASKQEVKRAQWAEQYLKYLELEETTRNSCQHGKYSSNS